MFSTHLTTMFNQNIGQINVRGSEEKPVVTLRVYEKRQRKDTSTGESIDYLQWSSIVIFGYFAKKAATQLVVGDRIGIIAQYGTRDWEFEGKSGVAHEFVIGAPETKLVFNIWRTPEQFIQDKAAAEAKAAAKKSQGFESQPKASPAPQMGASTNSNMAQHSTSVPAPQAQPAAAPLSLDDFPSDIEEFEKSL